MKILPLQLKLQLQPNLELLLLAWDVAQHLPFVHILLHVDHLI